MTEPMPRAWSKLPDPPAMRKYNGFSWGDVVAAVPPSPCTKQEFNACVLKQCAGHKGKVGVCQFGGRKRKR